MNTWLHVLQVVVISVILAGLVALAIALATESREW